MNRMFAWKTTALLALLALAVSPIAALAEAPPSFRKRGDADKEFATTAGLAVIKIVRSKPTKVAYLKHEYTNPKPGRTELSVKLEYYGAAVFRNKRFIADVVFIIDSNDKNNWEVVNIRYTDTNPTVASGSERRIQNLIKDFNR